MGKTRVGVYVDGENIRLNGGYGMRYTALREFACRDDAEAIRLNVSDKFDRVLLATGDGDFVRVVRALQNKGCRVEIVTFQNVSSDLRNEADLFMPGYLIPNMIPPTGPAKGGGMGADRLEGHRKVPLL